MSSLYCETSKDRFSEVRDERLLLEGLKLAVQPLVLSDERLVNGVLRQQVLDLDALAIESAAKRDGDLRFLLR